MGLISLSILEALGAQAPCWWMADALVPTACQHGFLLLDMAVGKALGQPRGFATAGTEASQRVPSGYLRDIRASDVDEMALTDPSRNTDQGV